MAKSVLNAPHFQNEREKEKVTVQLVEIKFSANEITGRLADSPDKDSCKIWIDFRIPADTDLVVGTVNGDMSLGDMKLKRFVTVQLAILRHVRDLVGAETQRLASL